MGLSVAVQFELVEVNESNRLQPIGLDSTERVGLWIENNDYDGDDQIAPIARLSHTDAY